MVRTVVAIENERLAAAVCAALERAGIDIRLRCRTGAEAIRAVGRMGGGTVICQFILPDMGANELYEALRSSASVLVAAKPQYLAMCQSDEMYRLPLPANTGELVSMVKTLVEIDDKRVSAAAHKRSPEEQKLVDEAKALLMRAHGITETAAHRYLQRKSMNCGLTMAETASSVIEILGDRQSG